MLDDIRTYARLQIDLQQTMTRAEYVQAVRVYAVGKYGESAQSIADQTARHAWDSRQ